MKNRRTVNYHHASEELALPTATGHFIGRRLRLKNRRVSVGRCGENYSVQIKSLTNDRRVSVLQFALTGEALAALNVAIELCMMDSINQSIKDTNA